MIYAVTGVPLKAAQGYGGPPTAAAKGRCRKPVRLSATPSPAKAEVEGLEKFENRDAGLLAHGLTVHHHQGS